MKNEAVEQWRPVPFPEWSTLFEVSSEGRVRRRRDGMILMPQLEGPGQALRVALYNAERKQVKLCRVARLVLDSFRPEASNAGHVTYADGNPGNCCLENLSYPPPRPEIKLDENGEPAKGPTVKEVAERNFADCAPLCSNALERFRVNPDAGALLTEAERQAIAARLASLEVVDAGAPEPVRAEAA